MSASDPDSALPPESDDAPPPPPVDEAALREAARDRAVRAGTAPSGLRQFPCASCGARMEFRPGTRRMQCPYCGYGNELPPDPADMSVSAVRELDFDAYAALAGAQAADGGAELDATVAHCRGCGADITLPPDVAADFCPYCTQPVVAADAVKERIRVQAVLPFKVARAEAEAAWKRWLAGLWFAPSRLKTLANKTGALAGMYLPYWTFDSDTRSAYRGARGDHYYATVTRTVTVNGRAQVRTSQERRTRWTPAGGTVERFFDDVLVPASRLWSENLLNRLEPWDLPQLEAYRPEFLGGFRAEKFQVGLAPGFARAQERMAETIRADVARAIGGDEQRIDRIATDHRDVTFKHVMLPLWTSAYMFRDKLYHFYVNARTGQVSGERPWSVWKIALLALALAGLIGLAAWRVAGGGGTWPKGGMPGEWSAPTPGGANPLRFGP